MRTKLLLVCLVLLCYSRRLVFFCLIHSVSFLSHRYVSIATVVELYVALTHTHTQTFIVFVSILLIVRPLVLFFRLVEAYFEFMSKEYRNVNTFMHIHCASCTIHSQMNMKILESAVQCKEYINEYKNE